MTEIDSLRRGWQACEARLAAVEAERDAARAGEARAVEALKRIAEDADSHLNDNVLIGNPTRWRLKTIRACAEDAISQPALDWLAQREREAAAVELEMLRDHIKEYIGPDHARDDIRRICANRIKDLRAGKKVDNA